MKRFRSTLLLLLAVLAVGVWWWRDQSRPDENPLRFDPKRVRAVRVQSGPRALLLSRRGEAWTVRSTQNKKILVPDAPADAPAVADLLRAWSSAAPSTARADQPAKLAELGLGPNATTIAIEGDEKITIALGSRVRIDPRFFYARVQNGSTATIALLPQSLLAPLERPIAEWRDGQLLAFDIENITRIEATSQGTSTTLLRRGTAPSSTWRWQSAGGRDFPLDPIALQSVVSSLQGLRAQKFAPLSARDSGSRNAFSIRLHPSSGPPLWARIGDIASKGKEGETIRATSSRLPDVALIEAQGARAIESLWRRPTREWRLKALFDFRVDEASEISVRAHSREGKWKKIGERSWRREPALPAAPGEEEAARTRNAITDLLQKMSELQARDFRDVDTTRGTPWTRILELRVRTPRGVQVLEVGREEGQKFLGARIQSTSRDDEGGTIFVLDHEALEPFQIGQRVLLK